ncbi:hypothetical protein UlMin_018947 [Ulmus minor]
MINTDLMSYDLAKELLDTLTARKMAKVYFFLQIVDQKPMTPEYISKTFSMLVNMIGETRALYFPFSFLLHQCVMNSACYAPEQVGPALKPKNMHHVGSSLPNAFANGGSLLHTGIHNVVEMSAHAGRIDATQNMLSTQNSNIGLMQGVNGGIIKPEVGEIIKLDVGGIIKSEVGFSSSNPYMFDNNVLGARQSIGEAFVPPFNGVESNTQTLNESHLNPETFSFGFLGHIPRNFSLSDLTNDFSQSSLLYWREGVRSPHVRHFFLRLFLMVLTYGDFINNKIKK